MTIPTPIQRAVAKYYPIAVLILVIVMPFAVKKAWDEQKAKRRFR